MRALVIGGNRFFGKRLVSRLLDRGVDVTVLNRGNLSDSFGERIRRVRMDRSELINLGRQEWDVVFDQVAYETGDALGACEAFAGRARRYVFVSSQSVYGPGAGLREQDFDPTKHPFEPAVSRQKDYSEGKRQAEAVFFQRADFPVVAVRFPIVLGEDDYTERLKFHVDRVRDGKAIHFPAIDARISLIHAPDAAEFLETLGTNSVTGPINVCAREPIVLRDLIGWIEQEVGRKAVLADRPEDGEGSPFGAESDWFMSTDRLREALGTEPQAIERWLPDLIRSLHTK